MESQAQLKANSSKVITDNVCACYTEARRSFVDFHLLELENSTRYLDRQNDATDGGEKRRVDALQLQTSERRFFGSVDDGVDASDEREVGVVVACRIVRIEGEQLSADGNRRVARRRSISKRDDRAAVDGKKFRRANFKSSRRQSYVRIDAEQFDRLIVSDGQIDGTFAGNES